MRRLALLARALAVLADTLITGWRIDRLRSKALRLAARARALARKADRLEREAEQDEGRRA